VRQLQHAVARHSESSQNGLQVTRDNAAFSRDLLTTCPVQQRQIVVERYRQETLVARATTRYRNLRTGYVSIVDRKRR
jgi:hypothetical protein